MSEHDPTAWDDPEADDEDDDEREAQGEDPTSLTRGFEDAEDLEEFDAEEDED
jgi:hypothetical protein